MLNVAVFRLSEKSVTSFQRSDHLAPKGREGHSPHDKNPSPSTSPFTNPPIRAASPLTTPPVHGHPLSPEITSDNLLYCPPFLTGLQHKATRKFAYEAGGPLPSSAISVKAGRPGRGNRPSMVHKDGLHDVNGDYSAFFSLASTCASVLWSAATSYCPQRSRSLASLLLSVLLPGKCRPVFPTLVPGFFDFVTFKTSLDLQIIGGLHYILKYKNVN